MPRTIALAVCAVLAAAVMDARAIAADVKPLETVAGWGLVVDPVGDCAFEHAGDKFAIKVPGAYHDLWPLKGQVNAPLVLQEASGDFTIEVLVEDVTKATADTVLPGMASTASYHAAVLVVWQDAKNFVRLDRTDMHNRGRAITSCYLQVFANGEKTVELSPIVPDKPTHLRLSRKGDRLLAAYSQDGGKTWRDFPMQKFALAGKIKAGVCALNNTSRENVARFSGLKLTK
jgi:regulation of enolase protein 1 (concanavalin A-like superfamily)